MKKIMALIFTAILMFGISSPVFASEEKDIEKALEMIEQTNLEIEKKIEKGVTKADKLHAEYLRDIQRLEEDEKLENDLAKRTEQKEKLDAKYEKKLDKIIARVYDQTFEMSARTVEMSAELGVEAECIMIEVWFGNKLVEIDPVRVVGY
ncbi:hypothetical protein JOC95_001584 [Bacillus tianshenii]|uniref:OmpH family outer membrane protein n=1 Tax=Sutcliffiella tianshenii TaxID=1463404 RepID=A0ABS2NYL7_9BACI|nr:hypothetical protein [Bacillus tianshenii]MBM7619732.1 hypothetical protein [Bacillus tianshenii]